VQLVTGVADDDPASLGQFLQESRESYPANRYALILTGRSSPPEIDEVEMPPLDLLLFSQSHTAHFDWMTKWQPYGRLAIGSPAFAAGWLTPAQLGRLTAELPEGEAAAWADWLLEDYVTNHPAPTLLDWQPLTAVDLQQFPQLAPALSGLSNTPPPVLTPLTDPFAMRTDAYNQHDLGQWALAVGESELVTAVSEAIVRTTSSRFNWQLAFSPATATAPPLVSAQSVHNLPLQSQQPAYLQLELAGVGLRALQAQVSRLEDDGRWRLLHLVPIDPPDGRWADGVHPFPWLWYPLTPYLSDGEAAGHLPLWPLADGRLAAAGQYEPGSGPARDGWLLLTPEAADLAPEIWLLPADPADWRAFRPQPGDGFTVYNHYLAPDGSLEVELGGLLELGSAAGLELTWRQLPPGDYRTRLVANNNAGATAVTEINWQAGPLPRWPGYTLYLDLETGFQLAYPETWPALQERDGRWQGQDPQQSTQFAITRLTDRPGATAGDLQQDALAIFGDVERLLEESITIDGRPALLTAYGYNGPDGPRTGLLLTFVRDGAGYLVDIDGPLAAEAANLAVARAVAESWAFWPPVGSIAGEWHRLETDHFAAYMPSSYQHEPLANGWHLLRAPDTAVFLALRHDPADGRSSLEAARHWLAIAGRDVDNFAAKEPTRLALAGNLWTRIDFSYTQSNGQPVYGFIMTTAVDGHEWSAWAETPAADFEQLVAELFLTMVASMRRN